MHIYAMRKDAVDFLNMVVPCFWLSYYTILFSHIKVHFLIMLRSLFACAPGEAAFILCGETQFSSQTIVQMSHSLTVIRVTESVTQRVQKSTWASLTPA